MNDALGSLTGTAPASTAGGAFAGPGGQTITPETGQDQATRHNSPGHDRQSGGAKPIIPSAEVIRSILAGEGGADLDRRDIGRATAAEAPVPATAPAAAEAAVVGAGHGEVRVSIERLKRVVGDGTAAGEAAMRAEASSAGPVPGSQMGQYCLTVIEHIIGALYGPSITAGPGRQVVGGITSGLTRDDSMIEAGQDARRHLGQPATAWSRLDDWETLLTAIHASEPGTAMVVINEHPRADDALDLRHAAALVHTEDGVVLINPMRPGKATVIMPLGAATPTPGRLAEPATSLTTVLGPPINSRVLGIDPYHRVITPDWATTRESDSSAWALLDPANPRIGAPPRGSQLPSWYPDDDRQPLTDAEQARDGKFHELPERLAEYLYRLPLPPPADRWRVHPLVAGHLEALIAGDIEHAVNLISRYEQELFELTLRLHRIYGRVTVDPRLSDEKLRDYMEKNQYLKEKYPEICDHYLQRRDKTRYEDENHKSSSSDIADVFQHETIAVGSGYVHFHYDPTAAPQWIEARRALVQRAVAMVEAAGFAVPEFHVWAEKYSRVINVGIDVSRYPYTFPHITCEELPSFPTVFDSVGKNILLAPFLPSRDTTRGVSDLLISRWEGILVHEIGHLLHLDQSPDIVNAHLFHAHLTDKRSYDDMAMVSEYAQGGSRALAEFTAEYFTGLVFGILDDYRFHGLKDRDLPIRLARLYDAVGGPRPQRGRNEEAFPEAPFSDGEWAALINAVNEHPWVQSVRGEHGVDRHDIERAYKLKPGLRRIWPSEAVDVIARHIAEPALRRAPAGPAEKPAAILARHPDKGFKKPNAFRKAWARMALASPPPRPGMTSQTGDPSVASPVAKFNNNFRVMRVKMHKVLTSATGSSDATTGHHRPTPDISREDGIEWASSSQSRYGRVKACVEVAVINHM